MSRVVGQRKEYIAFRVFLTDAEIKKLESVEKQAVKDFGSFHKGNYVAKLIREDFKRRGIK